MPSLRSKVMGLGGYLPQNIVTNAQIAPSLQIEPEWIVERTGIHQRHVIAPQETTSDLALQAARQALEQAQWQPDDIDLLIVGTSTPDHVFPSTAVCVQNKLGLRQAVAFDVSAACAGFLFAMVTADVYLRQGVSQKALVVGADSLTRLVDENDRNTAILFGDGAGAMLLQAVTTTEQGVLGSILHTVAEGYDDLFVPGGPGSAASMGTIQMRGREVFKKAIFAFGSVIHELLEKHGLAVDDIDWFILHQANVRIIDAVARHFTFPAEKIVYTVARHANTSAASVPLALAEAVNDGRIRSGHLVLCAAFGAGFAWGATLIRF